MKKFLCIFILMCSCASTNMVSSGFAFSREQAMKQLQQNANGKPLHGITDMSPKGGAIFRFIGWTN